MWYESNISKKHIINASLPPKNKAGINVKWAKLDSINKHICLLTY